MTELPEDVELFILAAAVATPELSDQACELIEKYMPELLGEK